MNTKINFSLTQLEYVLAVHKYGHFAKAAEACNITQPTLSMQIQKLEESLNVVIFDRTKKPILTTDVGNAIIQQIQTVVSEAKKIENLIEMKGRDKLKGSLEFGVIPTIAPYILPLLLPVIENKFPGLSMHIRELQTHQIIEALDSDEIDVGLLAIPIQNQKIIEEFMYYEPFSVLCAKDHALSSQKSVKYSSLKADDLWLLEEGHCLRNQILDICKFRSEKLEKRKFKFESGSLETLKNLVDSYGGYTLLPQMAAHHIGRHSEIVEFERPIPAREIGLVYRREHYKIDLIKAVGESVQECIPKDLRKLKQKDLDALPPE